MPNNDMEKYLFFELAVSKRLNGCENDHSMCCQNYILQLLIILKLSSQFTCWYQTYHFLKTNIIDFNVASHCM